MGIDIYLKWDGQTKSEEKAQLTGFSTSHGHVGYLREAYHGGPYATRILFSEGFNSDNYTITLESKILEARLPDAIKATIEREKTIYHATQEEAESCPMIKSLKDFAALHKKLEADGRNPKIEISG